jgi:hypothetical protein
MAKNILQSVLLVGATVALLSFDLPVGWFIAGSKPKSYEMGIDKGAGLDGKNAATIKSIDAKIEGFGTLMQNSKPDKYLGKRVKMTGYMKSKEVAGWAGFWLRIDQADSKRALGFDNMHNRAVKGTINWTKFDIVLDVPANATNLAYGALVSGTGQIWFDNLNFEIVDNSVPLTITSDFAIPSEPTNLSFEN